MIKFYKMVYPNSVKVDITNDFIEKYYTLKDIDRKTDNKCDVNGIDDKLEFMTPEEIRIIDTIKYFKLEEYYKGYYCFILNKYKDFNKKDEISSLYNSLKLL